MTQNKTLHDCRPRRLERGRVTRRRAGVTATFANRSSYGFEHPSIHPRDPDPRGQ
jgi:hypothetical protein